MTRYEIELICPRCPNRQVIAVAFAEATDISYECTSCGATWRTPGHHRRQSDKPLTGRTV